jgi:hypothetical protein
MFRVKTTRRNVKRAISPLKVATDISGAFIQQPIVKEQEQSQLERRVDNFFEAESAAVSLSKPWLRLERGLRLQKYRAFAEAYPGLTPIEKESLYKVLMKANDAKLLNTKTTIQYEGGAIQSIKGLKMIRTGDPTIPAVFKIDVSRPTKKHTDDV